MSSSSMDTSLIRRIADELCQTSEDVCRALDASPEALAFLTQRCDGPAASPSTAEEPAAKVGIRGRKFIVLYVLSEDGEDGGGRPLIYADTSLDRVQPYFAASTNNTGHRTTTAHHRSLRACVFVRWRNDLMSFSISSVDVAHPLEDLQFTLHMYEQLLRQEWEPTSQVVSRMQELGDELDVVQHIPPKVDLRRYIYPDILQLCEDFPAMEVHQLMEQLGHLAKDSTYMEAVRKCRKPCVSVLRASHDIDRSEVAETELMLEVEPLKLRRVEEVGNRFRSVSAWIKDVQAQLESREWILANKIVLETDFRSDFIHTGDKMLKIIRYVESIPVKGLRTVTSLAELEVLAKNIFTAVVHPPMIAKDIGPMAVIHSAIKPPLMREVLMCSTSEIVVVFMRITEGRCVELLEALHPATNAAPQRSAAASYDAVVTVLAFLSSCVDFLHGMRENYMKHLLSKSDIPDVSCHPLLEALCQRSNMLETMVERHYRILAQLENAFAAKIELPKKDELPTERVKKAKMPTRGSGFQHEVDLVREECSSILHRSCAALVKAICSPPEHVSAPCISSSRRTVLWRTYAAAQEYVDASCATYAKGIEEADEFIVHHLKKILATEPGPSPGSLANASHGAEQVMRLFFIYSRFRFMDLPNLRELMTSLGIPATEAIIDRINAVVNDFTEGKHRSHDIRYAVEAYRVSAYVAHMLREHGLLQSLRQCLFWRDCVMDMGWHNLMSLRRANNVWRLDDKLMEYFHLRDTPLAELMNHPRDVVGTVFALSYLHRQYPEEPWRADAHLHIAQQYIANYDGIRSLTDYAEECLTGLGVFQRAQRAEKNQKLSVQRVHEYILRSLSDLTTKWCIQSSTQLRECGAMGGSGVLSTPVLRLQPRIGSSARGGEVSGATELVVEVSFPWQLEAISNDVQYMSSVYTFKKKDVLDEDVVSTLAQINESVRQNGGKARIAHTLRKLLAIYYATVDGEDDVLVLLTSDEYRRANHIILSGCNIHWNEDTQIFHFAVQLEESIRHLTHAVAIIRQKTSVIYRKLQELSSRPFHPDAIALWVGQIHAMVSGLAMDSRSATRWMRQTQPLLDAALMQQLKYLLHGWTMDFISLRGDPRYLQHTSTGTSQFHLLPLHVRMCLVYREVQLKPAAPEWRRHWLKHLNASFSWLHEQPPLELGQAAQAAILSNGTAGTRDDDDDGHGGHYYLLEQLPPEALAEPLRAIESCIQDAQAVEQQWRQSQQFLHMDPSIMQRRFGQNLRQWSDALQLMHQLIHRVMDVTEPNILLGGIAILAEEAQGSLRGKLDQVSSSMHGKFKDVLEAQLETSLKQLLADKSTADGLNVIGDTADACKFLCIATRLRNNLIAKEEEIMLMSSAESSLLQLGYVFPDNWVRTATLREEFMAYKDAIDRKSKALQVRRPYVEESARKRGEELHAKVAHLRERLRKVHGSGETQASVHGGEASGRGSVVDQQQIISIHDEACTVDEEAKEVVALQEALDMQRFDASEVEELKRDASDLLEVWAHVANLTSALHTLGATPLFEAVPRHVQEELKRLEKMAEAAPEPIQLNPIFVDAVAKVKAATSCRRLLQDLRSDAMASLERSRRHWVALKQQLQSKWVLEDLTLQHIWDSDPTAHAAIYASILEQAHGEHRLEVQLQAITSFWSAFEFSTTVYKQRVALLRGWDVVFERLEDDLSTFSGMRASPFFTSQQVVAMTNDSEAQLNRLRQVLEVLMETQKRWVYLDGVFAGNREIRSQLPRDASQFDRTSIELVGLMPQLRADGTLPEVKTNAFLDDPKMLSTLERLVNQLNGVQRALTSYLDTQRRKFPRFFFVGDDDLLEIMGNSRDPHVMGRHLKKMFSALANFMLPTEAVDGADVQIHGFSSADGECVRFSNNKVVWVGQRPMYDWLKEVEQLMATSLRTETLRATEALTANKRVSLDWLGTFPSQTLALALQLWWVRQQEEAFSVKTKDAIFHAPRMSFAQRERLRTSSGATPPTSAVIAAMEEVLTTLASSVLDARLASLVRHRCEQAITVAVYQRDCSRWLVRAAVQSKNDFEWARVLRLYTTTTTTTSSSSSSSSSAEDALVECRMADATVVHGFEYIGGYERLVQTPLTDKCYLTLMQALHARLGGSPVGPAGTGKTETVKALGMQLGRHVLIFNCDDTFDFQAVSRIFLGLCQVGAWGCFDEFNRLEERILSALSQQIQTIQESLRGGSTQVELSRQSVPLHTNVAVFITMNPGYAGRSNLPSNLKQLFRTITMAVPDRAIIAEVMLFAQGFHRAEALSKKMVPLFRLCEDQFSRQAHYDFGLRALKSVLIAAGDRKRAAVSELRQQTCTKEVNAEVEREAECTWVLESLIANIAPKLITHDLALFYPLLHDFFPDRDLPTMEMAELRAAIAHVCSTSGLTAASAWVEKICQLSHTRGTRHGIMLVGPSGTGKTMAWRTLMAAMVRVHPFMEVQAFVLEPKVLSKAHLFGSLDITTREWQDGVFTAILRRIIVEQEAMKAGAKEEVEASAEDTIVLESSSGGADALRSANHLVPTLVKEYWIIFDGDVDPEWVENLNSVLDDNKVLTLPNGERLALPRSVRIFFEVQNLRYATPATVSRCGMLWFSEGVVPLPSMLSYAYRQMERKPVADHRGRHLPWHVDDAMIGSTQTKGWRSGPAANSGVVVSCAFSKPYNQYIVSSTLPLHGSGAHEAGELAITPEMMSADLPRADGGLVASGSYALEGHPDALRLQREMMKEWDKAFERQGIIARGIQILARPSYTAACIMEFGVGQQLQSILSLLWEGIWSCFRAEQQAKTRHSAATLTAVAQHVMEYAVFWGLGAPMGHEHRRQLAMDLQLQPHVAGKPATMLEVEVSYTTGQWSFLRERLETSSITAEQVGANDTVIGTVDTMIHEALLSAWLSAGRSAILCGPPGSGKTMSVSAVLHHSPAYDAVFLNFSSGTTVEMVIKALEQYCSLRNTAKGLVLSPTSGKRLLLFCDEINLPAMDRYGTQTVLQLLRQIIERGGFYRTKDNAWVQTDMIQVVGACNPPTDAGRVPISLRVLRWAPVLFVDFPTDESLHIIYSTYCRAVLSFNEKLCRESADPLASAMVAIYRASQTRFTPLIQPHYLYSPRELSRWSRALHEAMMSWDDAERKSLDAAALVRLALHEGLRVFSDRLVSHEERAWADGVMDAAFREYFPALGPQVYARPLLYASLLSPAYRDCAREDLRRLLESRLPNFCDEEVSTPLVVFDAMVDHVVRIDRVLRQPLGHVLLAGSSGVGKTVMARLVAWLNGFSVFWLKAHRDYDLDDFAADLRGLLRRSGCKRERICFVFDESNIIEPSFLEYMNALLASGEVPGLFDGEEWAKLMLDVREAITGVPLANAGTGGGSGGAPAASPTSQSIDLSSDHDVYRWFLRNVREYLHVVFTINPASTEFSSRAVASPALFNRCTIDWCGDWDESTLRQITHLLTPHLVLLPSCREFASEEVAHAAVEQTVAAIHMSTLHMNADVRARSANVGTFITPRHFSDCVHHLRQLYEERQSGSVEQLRHLNNGLAKLGSTAAEVAAQQTSLTEARASMAERSAAAESMLERIISETDTTKKEKAEAENMRVQLQDEQERIAVDSAAVQAELAQAEPALRAAEAALNTVKPEYLREIRAYTTPPPTVKRVLESVVLLMGEKNCEWDILKSHIRREDFLSSVKAFKPTSIHESARAKVAGLLQDASLTVETANFASKAAGPLLQWVQAQLKFCAVFQSVAPMRAKNDQLAREHHTKEEQLHATEKEIGEKEAFLQQLKAEYQTTTEEIAELKHRITVVSGRCTRATTILTQLLDEQSRWESEIASFDADVSTAVGDCLVSAAFLAYAGFFDEQTRHGRLIPRWLECIRAGGITPPRPSFTVTDFLAPPAPRLQWQQCGLPKDRVCIENVAILRRCAQRYTFLVDPDGTAASFLQRFYAAEKISKASFSRPGYLKQLEMACRFGYPIIMEDAELLDQALAPLLNREFRHVGSRSIVRIGAHEIDLSNTFRLFLITRRSTFQPPPDLAGQVCILNFTVTISSLQSQCLQRVLLHERPDIDLRRTHLLNLQGAFHVKLRALEQDLLTSIAESEGSLLDNDQLIQTLTKLKHDAHAIQQDIQHSDESMRSILVVEERYRPVAFAASHIFFALRQLSELSCFYHFNVRFMFVALRDVMEMLPPKTMSAASAEVQPGGDGDGITSMAVVEEDPAEVAVEMQRLTLLFRGLFALVHGRVIRGVFQRDHLVLALRLAQLRSATCEACDGLRTICPIASSEWEWLISGFSAGGGVLMDDATSEQTSSLPSVLSHASFALSAQSRTALTGMFARPEYAEIVASMKNKEHAAMWSDLLLSSSPLEKMQKLPDTCFPPHATPCRREFLLVVMLYFVRRDLFVAAAFALLHRFFDGDVGAVNEANPTSMPPFFDDATQDLERIMAELNSSTPLIMISEANYDPSTRVEQLARHIGFQLNVVAMGSGESVQTADVFLQDAMRSGGWVLLKNAHLARDYVEKMEKAIHFHELEGSLHHHFRFFISAERGAHDATCVLPISLLEISVVVVYEMPPGMQSSLLQTYAAMPTSSNNNSSSMDAGVCLPGSSPCQRLLLSAAWAHAAIVERLTYVPMGWAQMYEFSDTEFSRVAQAVLAWSSSKWLQSSSSTAPEVAWDALRAIIATTIYGGKVSNDYDQRVLDLLCEDLLSPELFSDAFSFLRDASTTTTTSIAALPTTASGDRAAYLQWLRRLPDGSSDPQWIGLPSGVSRMVHARRALDSVERLAMIQSSLTECSWTSSTKHNDDRHNYDDDDDDDDDDAGSARWLIAIRELCAAWGPLLRSQQTSLLQNAFVAQVQALREAEHTGELMGAAPADHHHREVGGAGEPVAPLVLALQREVVVLLNLLEHVVKDVALLQDISSSTRKPTAASRALVNDVSTGRVPSTWAALIPSEQCGSSTRTRMLVGSWLAEVRQRSTHLRQLAEAAEAGVLHNTAINLGLLFAPGAYLTASKQQHARQSRLSLESLCPTISLTSATHQHAATTTGGGGSLLLTGIVLFGARLSAKGDVCELIAPTGSGEPEALSSTVGLRLTWEQKSANHGSATNTAHVLEVPLYATSDREVLLERVELPVAAEATKRTWYVRGVCLAAWAAEE